MKKIDVSNTLHSYVKASAEWLAQELLALHGENVISIALYGSATGQSFSPKKSNINSVVVFKDITGETLQKSLKLIKKGAKKKIVAPLFFTLDHIKSSCDSFPMEFCEIQETQSHVYGEDIFSSLVIEKDALRLECEQQTKALVIKLRQSYLEVGLERKGVESLIRDSFRAVLPVFRAILRLNGEAVPLEAEKLIMQVASLSKVSPSVFMFVLRDKKGDEKIAGKSALEFLGNYLAELTKLARYVDEM